MQFKYVRIINKNYLGECIKVMNIYMRDVIAEFGMFDVQCSIMKNVLSNRIFEKDYMYNIKVVGYSFCEEEGRDPFINYSLYIVSHDKEFILHFTVAYDGKRTPRYVIGLYEDDWTDENWTDENDLVIEKFNEPIIIKEEQIEDIILNIDDYIAEWSVD